MSVADRQWRMVLYASSFRQDGSRGGVESPNIAHAVQVDEDRTLCGRKGWVTDEDVLDLEEALELIGCLRCHKVLSKYAEES